LIVWGEPPILRAEVVQVAWFEPFTGWMLVAPSLQTIAVAPSLNCTVPVAVLGPACGVTVAVKVTG
jgi:hypothetical protein